MYVRIGPVSFNTKTKKINFDRRTIKGQPKWKHAAFIVGGLVATAVVVSIIEG